LLTDFLALEQALTLGCFQQSNEISDYMKIGKFIEQVMGC
jgi:hypothetical protein